jgi:predicted MFS family arabinose efflux permease
MSTPSMPKGLLNAFLFGNFVIGCGVMLVPATLNQLSHDLGTSVPVTGQLITAGAVLMGLGAPTLAALLYKLDRRQLLMGSMLWFALFHALCALMPSFWSLFPLRVLAMVSPAVFTPQAAACVGLLTNHETRARGVTYIFLGWSLASVIGVPLLSSIGGYLGWRYAFVLVSLLSLVCALWVYRVMPRGIYIAALGRSAWAAVLGHKALMLTVLVTVISAFGQFVLFAYLTAYYTQVLGADTATMSVFFLWFGFFGLVGNVLLSRYIESIGADRAPPIAMSLMALSLLLWPLGSGMVSVMLILLPWGLGCFASNSAQQARLVQLAPGFAGASVALNTSAIYGGQALGSGLGGWLISQGEMLDLHWYGFVLVSIAIVLSIYCSRLTRRLSGSST